MVGVLTGAGWPGQLKSRTSATEKLCEDLAPTSPPRLFRCRRCESPLRALWASGKHTAFFIDSGQSHSRGPRALDLIP
jgi:hypothetical protein